MISFFLIEDVSLKAVHGQLELKIFINGQENNDGLYNILSESEIKRFSLVVLHAMIKFGKYNTLILDDPIDSYDDYYLHVACDYIKKIILEKKLNHWFILTNSFEALNRLSNLLKCNAIIFYHSPEDVFSNQAISISSFESSYKEIDIVSKNELVLLNGYLSGKLAADADLSFITFIVTLRNFKTIILKKFENLFLKKYKTSKLTGINGYYVEEDFEKMVKILIEHYYMHYDEEITPDYSCNSNTIPVNLVAKIFDILSSFTNPFFKNLIIDSSSLVSKREAVARKSFNSFSGSKILNLIFIKIAIVSFLKFEYEKILITKLKTKFHFAISEIKTICSKNGLKSKLTCAMGLNKTSSHAAEDFLHDYKKVFDRNERIFNLFDHALEQMFPPYIVTSIKDIRKFRIEIEVLDTNY